MEFSSTWRFQLSAEAPVYGIQYRFQLPQENQIL